MLKAMIVDDVEIIRIDIKRLKIWGEEYGFEVHNEASNGHEALLKLDTDQVDLLLTDIRMPKINGIELLEKVKERRLATCVVLLSDHCDFNYARQGIVHGAFDFIPKPVSEEEMKSLLGRCRDYILKKKEEESRLKLYVDNRALYSPENDIRRIVEFIQRADTKAAKLFEEMIGKLSEEAGSGRIENPVPVINAMNRLVDEVLRIYPWLDRFVDLRHIEDYDYFRLTDLEALNENCALIIREITDTIDQFICSRSDTPQMRQLCLFIIENIENGISEKVLSEKFFFHRTYLSDFFRKKAGISLINYIKLVKIARAKKLLGEGHIKVFEIAGLLGYKDTEYFCKMFKAYTGITPAEYKDMKA